MDIERILLRLAQDNDGVLARKDAIEGGCSARAIDRRLAAGLLIPLFPGIYRLASHPDTYQARARAAWMWGGEGALLAGGTVLALFGLDGFDEPRIELYRATGKMAPGIVTRRLPPDRMARRSVGGMTCTSIERALLDACRIHSAMSVGTAMDDALRRGFTTIARLRAAIPADRRGIKGAKRFARLVQGRDLDDQTVRSELETRMLKILRRIKGHNFTPNFEVRARRRYFLDFAFPQVLLAIECQSRRHHGPSRLDNDFARHRDLELLGWAILYYTWDDVVFRPQEVQKEIEEFLIRRTGPSAGRFVPT